MNKDFIFKKIYVEPYHFNLFIIFVFKKSPKVISFIRSKFGIHQEDDYEDYLGRMYEWKGNFGLFFFFKKSLDYNTIAHEITHLLINLLNKNLKIPLKSEETYANFCGYLHTEFYTFAIKNNIKIIERSETIKSRK